MAEVEFLLENLLQQLLDHYDLMKGVREQVEELEKVLRLVKAFFKDTSTNSKKQEENEYQKALLREIRNTVFEAEEIIDTYVAQVSENNSRNYFARTVNTRTIHSISAAERIESLCAKIRDMARPRREFSLYNFISSSDGRQGLEDASTTQPLSPRRTNILGLDDETETVIGYLKEESEELDVIAIVGMPGIGKTTLASKIYHDEEIECRFPIRIWIDVSDEFSKNDVFLSILNTFTYLTEDMKHKDDQELARLAATYLEEHIFLVVVDNVWSPNDWDRIREALPMSNKRGKVLITSCNEHVGRHANRYRVPLKVPLLNQSQSWSLLKLEVFGEPECPHELEDLGHLISKQCGGLPLALLVMAGILIKYNLSSSDLGRTRELWTRACQRIPEYRDKRFYNSLPYHLRICFLYFGMFPYDFEIPVWKLLRMWVAEGFVQQHQGISLEKTAETYLEDLINRNLVTIGLFKSDGRVKTCRMHRMLHDICKAEARNERGENVLQEIEYGESTGETQLDISEENSKYRRLCIHSNVLRFLSTKPFGSHVRSFVSFSKEEINLPLESTSAIPGCFKLLRVLDIKPIIFTKISSDIYQLVHLRYLVLSFNSAILPCAFSKLWNIQTLVVNTTSSTLEIRADILKLTQLRHFMTNASATLAKIGKPSGECAKLQTLCTISPESCKEEVLDRAPKLKKLGIRGQLSLLFDKKTGSFDCLSILSHLKILKLRNEAFPGLSGLPSEGRLSLPTANKFPPTLRCLTISGTRLDWSEMRILGSLENLEVLKLKNNAFVGRNWVTDDGGFLSLEVLHIGRTDLVFWVASARHFPRLRHLALHNCEELKEVPVELADIPSLQKLDLFHTTLATASANRILEEKQKFQAGQSMNDAGVFVLSMYPPGE